jgi:cation diffusion facilitator family transporter
MEQKYMDLKLGEKGVILSIFVYLCLSILKLVIGYTANSEALKADGLNNTTDIIASIAVLIGLKISQRPADKDHPYGHWKAETVASMVAAFIMVGVGLYVLYNATLSVFDKTISEPDWISALTGLFCAVIMYGVYIYNRNLARKINSQSVMAAAKDNLSDAWVSIGTVIGITGSQFGLPWLDPVTAVVVGLLIVKTGWDIFREASHDLTDGFDEEQLKDYKNSIADIPGVKEVKEIRARKYGNNPVVDVIILVNSTLDIGAAHDISMAVEDVLMKEYDVFEVHVHVEPN